MKPIVYRLLLTSLYERTRRAPRYLPQEQHRAVVALLELIGEWLRTGDPSALAVARAVERRLELRLRPPADLRPGRCWSLAVRCLLSAAEGIAAAATDAEVGSYLSSAERMLLRADGLRGQA